MDPNEALRRLRDCMEASEGVMQSDEMVDYSDLIESMVELFTGLDEWLSKGGFLPNAWMPQQGVTMYRRVVDGHTVWTSQPYPEPLGPPNPAGVELPEHDARPDDDNQPGDRCKDCGRRITWVGPSHLDWAHVPRDMDELIASDTQGLLD